MWGLAGGVLVELLELAARTRAHKTFPWLVPNEMSLGAYIYCALTRPAAGAIVAVALGMTDQITGPWGLLVVGAGAPLIIQNAMRQPTHAADEVPVPGTVVAEEGEGGTAQWMIWTSCGEPPQRASSRCGTSGASPLSRGPRISDRPALWSACR